MITDSTEEGRSVLRHSAAHVLAQAVLSLYDGATFAIGPAIEDGFYYDFDIGRPFTPDDLEQIEEKMDEIIAADQPFVRETMSKRRKRSRSSKTTLSSWRSSRSVDSSEVPEGRKSPSIATTVSWICVGDRMCPPPAASAP